LGEVEEGLSLGAQVLKRGSELELKLKEIDQWRRGA